MELKGSKTEKNLLAAFAGESQARVKYEYYSSKAKKEGYEQISEIFDETSRNEKEHAKLWFKALHDSDIPETEKNLVDAANGENYEYSEMYKEFAEEARTEGFNEIANLFEGVANVEREHEKRYLKLIDNIKKNEVFEKDSEVIWICRNCGHVYKAKKAHKICPVCSHPQSYMEVKCSNY